MSWNRTDMSTQAILLRMKKKARPTKFSEEEEKILAGWCIYKDLTHESSTTTDFKQYAYSYFGKTMSNSYISKFLKRYKLSMKLVGNFRSIERREDVIENGVQFLEKINFLIDSGIDPSKIKVSLSFIRFSEV